MNIGMLWFDQDPKKSMQAKIIEAADYYRKKYGQVPNTCFIPVKETPLQVGVITARPWRSIMPGHLWIGCEVKSGSNQLEQ